MSNPATVQVSVALPVYNEERVLEQLHRLITQACQSLGFTYEVLYIDDGSTDGTGQILEGIALRDPGVSIVTLSRNFGLPGALAAAVDLAAGQSLVIMDADMQDDPTIIPRLLRIVEEQGAEVVYVVRTGRSERWPMRFLFATFHWLISSISDYPMPRNAGNFGLVGPRALAEMRKLTERLRYFPGLRAFVGFRQVPLYAPRRERYDRTPRVRFWQLVRQAGLAFFTQSQMPIKIFYVLSAASLAASFVLIAYAALGKIVGYAVVAWASTITAVSFFSGMIILGQGFICEYLSRIYEEVRGRPIYVVETIRQAEVVRKAERTVVPSEGERSESAIF